MAEKSQCNRRLVKIAENNVEDQYYLLSPVDGSKVVLTEYTTSYGQIKIDTDRADADANWSFWDGLDAQGIADMISDAAKEVEFYDNVQTVMNAADGTMMDID